MHCAPEPQTVEQQIRKNTVPEHCLALSPMQVLLARVAAMALLPCLVSASTKFRIKR